MTSLDVVKVYAQTLDDREYESTEGFPNWRNSMYNNRMNNHIRLAAQNEKRPLTGPQI